MIGFLSLYRAWRLGRAKLFTRLCRPDFKSLGAHTMIELPLRIEGARHVEIGARVFIGPNSWLEVLHPSRPVERPAISIGSGTAISGFCTISSARQVIIESHVLIARYVYIADHTHATAAADRPIKAQGITKIAPVRICEGAWLGQSVVVCPGVTIGRNAVIGANSVVRDDVPDHCVAVGAPARVVRGPLPLLSS